MPSMSKSSCPELGSRGQLSWDQRKQMYDPQAFPPHGQPQLRTEMEPHVCRPRGRAALETTSPPQEPRPQTPCSEPRTREAAERLRRDGCSEKIRTRRSPTVPLLPVNISSSTRSPQRLRPHSRATQASSSSHCPGSPFQRQGVRSTSQITHHSQAVRTLREGTRCRRGSAAWPAFL